ncbi:hypothetical protein [Janthinobacterium sp.]|uniref:hypothetical protein n=1 Tax=Janthinobacterium sp. TaxID=1871054 RepID=UPI00293D9239|nr:hypothetical protein [Janthinobacterium sp.]
MPNTLNSSAPTVTLLRHWRALWRQEEDGPSRAALAAALAAEQEKNAALLRINLRQLDSIGALTARGEAMAAEHAATNGQASLLEDKLAAARADTARERRAYERLGAAFARVQVRADMIPQLEADLGALWQRLRRHEESADAGEGRH